MSKKLIAVASASAIALSALVGIAPATALPVQYTNSDGASNILVTGTVSRGNNVGSIATPYLVNVPSSGLATSATMVRFVVSSDVKSRPLSVTTTSGIKLLDKVADSTNKYTAASGSGSWTSTTDASGAAEFWAFPTTTTKGSITINLDGDITMLYMTGIVGPAYDIGAVTLPSLEPSKEGVIVAVVTDAFGNAVDVDDNQSLTVTRVGTGATVAPVDVAYSATSKRWEGTVTAGATAGQLAVGLTISGLTATDAQKAAFGAPNNTYFGIITVGAAKTVAELTAEVNALKADYNKLAARWNKLVASKKAPKKTVATK
jgi:hypothetical protein